MVGTNVSQAWLIVSDTMRSMFDEIQFMLPTALPSHA
jgi:hypothetical protein